MAYIAPHLSPHLIARSLDDLKTWQIPDDTDLSVLHRGVLRALLATDALANLELPLDMPAPKLDRASDLAEWDVVAILLAKAEAALVAAAHRQRIVRLHQIFPGHATQLERVRREAVDRLRQLRARVDFVCQGPGQAHAPSEPVHAPRSSLLQ
jgi:hypothetical protein